MFKYPENLYFLNANKYLIKSLALLPGESYSLSSFHIIQPQIILLIIMFNLGLGFLQRFARFSSYLNNNTLNQQIQHFNPLQVHQVEQMYFQGGLNGQKNLIILSQLNRNQPEFKILVENTQTEQKEQIIQINQYEHNFFQPSNIFESNSINERIKTLQYEANNPCEDSYSFAQLKTINAYTVSVFDGHGGSQLSEYSKQKINNFIDCFLKDNATLNKGREIGSVLKQALKWSYTKLEDTFYQIYENQLKLGNRKIKNVGTCAITAIVHNDRVYVANAGDSQGIFILQESKSLIRSEKLNERLNVNNKNQRQRIIEKWKDVDQEIVVQQSNNTYYLKGRLQPTRTIGDYYLKKENHFYGQGSFKGPYLSCEPDILEYKLTKNHKYMVIASDGVWDVLSRNQKQIDINKTWYEEQQREEAPYLSNIVNDILEKSSSITGKTLEQLKRMQKGKRRNYHDDITIAVLSLHNQV